MKTSNYVSFGQKCKAVKWEKKGRSDVFSGALFFRRNMIKEIKERLVSISFRGHSVVYYSSCALQHKWVYLEKSSLPKNIEIHANSCTMLVLWLIKPNYFERNYYMCTNNSLLDIKYILCMSSSQYSRNHGIRKLCYFPIWGNERDEAKSKLVVAICLKCKG